MSMRQSIVALPTIEVEYMVATNVSKDVVCLQILHLGMGLVQQE